MTVHPYVYGHPEEGAFAYRRRGWWPIPIYGKTIPPRGVTGRQGVVTDDDVLAWAQQRAGSNLGLRHDGTIAIDVDAGYGGKNGAQALAAWAGARRLGPLPATWSSTARGDDSPSRQYLYRVPDGLELNSKPCLDVEVCQRHHRFTVAWPSIHPDAGVPYRWYGPGAAGAPPAWGRRSPPPRVESLPWLPRGWARALAVRPVVVPTTFAGVKEVDELVAGFAGGPPSGYVVELLGTVCDPAVHLGHDEALRLLFQAYLLGLEGHPGVPDLLLAITTRLADYLAYTRPGSVGREIEGLTTWCSRTAQAKHAANASFWGLATGVPA